MTNIQVITGREILDSRGNPTVEKEDERPLAEFGEVLPYEEEERGADDRTFDGADAAAV